MPVMMAMRMTGTLAQFADRRDATLLSFAANMLELDGRVVDLKTSTEQRV